MMRVVHWFRNDLRLRDNVALAAAAASGDELVPVFVLDPRLLVTAGPRRRFLLDCLRHLQAELGARGCPLVLRRGDPVEEIPRLLHETRAGEIVFNRDYTPYARRRDGEMRRRAEKAGVVVRSFKDRVIFEGGEVRNRAGDPFRVYTPYRNAWRARFEAEEPSPLGPVRLPPPVTGVRGEGLSALAAGDDRGEASQIPAGGEEAARRRLRAFADRGMADYAHQRDLPGVDGTSRLSPHLRFGTISIRVCVAAAREAAREDRAHAGGARRWLDELVWREFYQAILAEHPRLLRGAFRQEYERVRWNDDEAGFRAWCEGRTGYPLVDAGMRQLAQTGWMHNRARMVAASFLVKDLLIDWRRGEKLFLERLVDGDPASNNGGWQWTASTGTDAQPYFRVFNPVAQGERYDRKGAYVRRFVPELRAVAYRCIHHPWDAPSPPRDYPPPIVDHAERRAQALERFRAARRAKRS